MIIRCMNCMREYDDSEACCPDCGFVRGTPPKEIYHLYPEVVLADRYIIGTVVAYGGFGILYRAWDQKLQVMVAVKEYFPSSYVNRNPGERQIFIYTSKRQGEFQDGLESFLAEARNTAKFSSHPNIVNVYDYFKENGTAYMVMEYMDGMTLKQHTKLMGGRLQWQEAVEILASICDDLQVVHEAGILHRDISPDNIMLCRDGNMKLFDFGAARFSDMERDVTRTIILKIGFAPPEQYRAKSIQGPWTDVYALGATLYRTITGVLPDESVNRQEALLKEGRDTLVAPREYVSDLPDYLNIAICKAMAIQAELRFKDVREFKDALLNRKTYLDVQEELKRRKFRRKLGIAGLSIALLGGIASCVAYYCNRQNEMMLKGAEVTVWAITPEDEENEERKQVLEQMLEEFWSDYPEVKVNLTCIPEQSYANELQKAADSGKFPVLYECPPEGVIEEHQDDLSEIYTLLNPEDYYCLDLQGQGNPIYQIPLGMSLPVVYTNTRLLNEGEVLQNSNDPEAFLNGSSRILVSDTDSYDRVQQNLPGIYEVRELESDAIYVRYDQKWAVDCTGSAMNRKAAKRILYYFLGETAQDILHVQNENSLPLNRNELEAYLDINQEFDFLKEQLEQELTVILTEEEFRKQLDSCYENLIADGHFSKAQ